MKYNHQKIEKKWAKVWQEEKIYEPNLKNPLGRSSGKKNFYNLMMFPYPSAEGLHVGNMYAFTGSDIHGRFKRMRDYNVFEPIGLDGFGIHSENYALKINVHPKKQSKISEKRFYKQLESIGNGFSWDERLETYDQEYYRWTQWIFTQLFNRGLAYRKKQAVNWCLSCQTVLADEQVISGECERCSNQVIQKELEQWFFKITTYAEKLLKNLDQLDWSERVKIAQKNWIGKSEGSLIKFKVKSEKLNVEEDLEVFTTRPDTLFGATYVVIAPEHELIASLLQTTIPSVILSEAKDLLKIKNFEEVKKYIEETKAKTEIERTNETKEKTGVELLGIKAINPANQELLPIFVSDYVLGGVGTGAIMAVPAHDQRDYDFAKKFNLPIKIVICPNYPAVTCPILESAYTGQGHLVASGQFDGLESERAKEQITKFVGGVKKTKYRLRDWLISRQRYWGPPIPMIFCESCAEETKNEKLKTKSKTGNKKNFNLGELENPGWFAVSEKDLPVELPNLKNFRPQGTGESPLASLKSFSETKCPKCQRKAKRETDVSDNFLDSTWYFFRYLDSSNQKQIFDQKLIKNWLPVDMYIGGAEHSVLHLLYSRFITMVFKDLGLITFDEPFQKFRAHGLVIKDGTKMSKSKGNVVNPDSYLKKFGADILRTYLMFLSPFEAGGDFRDESITGVSRFLERVYKLMINGKWKMVNGKMPKVDSKLLSMDCQALEKLLHKTIKKVTEDLENIHYNTAISALMILFNEMEKQVSLSIIHCQLFLKLLAPFAPYLTEELWQVLIGDSQRAVLGKKVFRSIHKESWPSYDPKLIIDETYTLIIQVNGKMRSQMEVEKDITQAEAELLALNDEAIKKWIGISPIKKTIFVSGKLINFVI